MGNERLIIASICAAGFLIVAFTPIVPIMLKTYDITNIYIIKATIGLLTLTCGWGVIWSLFRKENEVKTRKEGKLRFRPVLMVAGILLIGVAWFTDVPLWLSDWTGLSTTFSYNGETLNGGVGLRIWTSVLTGIGIVCLRFSTYREKQFTPKTDEGRYLQMLQGDESGGGLSW